VDGFVTGCQVETVIFVKVIEAAYYSVLSPTASPQFSISMQENAKMIEEEEKSSASKYLAMCPYMFLDCRPLYEI